jgi:hypothetical protein
MKSLERLSVLGAVLATLLACAGSGGSGPGEPKVARQDVAARQMRATVVGVDQATRTVTLRNEAGETLRFRAGEDVRNLAQVKAGDQMVGQVVESLAIEVREPTPEELAAPAAVAEDFDRAALGEKPGAQYVRVMREVFRIEGIDQAAGTVTVASYADGERSTIKARDPRNLERVDVGDSVVLTYTESLTLAVVPPGS